MLKLHSIPNVYVVLTHIIPQLRYLQTLNNISAEKNSTIVFPVPVDIISQLMGGGDKERHAKEQQQQQFMLQQQQQQQQQQQKTAGTPI